MEDILNKRFLINPDIIMEKENDGALLFNQETGEIKILNITGAFVCEHLNGLLTGYEIIEKIRDKFDCSETDTLENDMKQLLQEMENASLLVTEVSHEEK